MPLELVKDFAREYGTSLFQRSPNEREFLPAALEIIEAPASPAGRLVIASICCAAVFALAWACIGKMDIIATAQGQVIPVGNTKTIQPMEIGTVKAIRVANGDFVHKGQVLIELDPVEAQADRTRYHDDLRHAQFELAKSSALWLSIENGNAPKLQLLPSNASPQELEAVRTAVASEYQEQVAALADLDQQVSEKTAEIAAANSSIQKTQAIIPYLQQQVDLREQLLKLQFSNRLAYLQAQQALVEQQRQVAILNDQKDQASAQRSALQQKRKEASASYQKDILDELSKDQAQVSSVQASEIKSAQTLTEKTLRAPLDGTVQQLAVHTVGGVVTPAQALLVVVPSKGGLLVEARISNRDIGFVHAGQPVKVKISAFNFTKYGLVDGTVASVSHDAVSPDKKEDKQADSDKQSPESDPVYLAYIGITKNWMDTEEGRSTLAPGMTVSAEIHTGRRRIIDYLLSPLQQKVSESMHER